MTICRVVHVVEDDPAVRRSVAFLLESARFGPIPWARGDTFLESVERYAPGCVLLDYQMPGMDGLAVQNAMAARGIALPVIFLSGSCRAHIVNAALRAGAVDFLVKPISKSQLVKTLDEAFLILTSPDRWRERRAFARAALSTLTQQEREVTMEIADGHGLAAISRHLDMSEDAITAARRRAMTKLGICEGFDLMKMAIVGRQ